MTILTFIKTAIKRLPVIRKLVAERDQLRVELAEMKRFVPPGHFYSPIPALDEVKKDESQIFENIPHEIGGIDMHETEQLALLNEFIHYYQESPFQAQPVEGLSYYFENTAYTYSDAIILYCMIRSLKPRRIIEVGSGFSSCVTLDTNRLFFNNTILFTSIEPYPALLKSLVKGTGAEHIDLIPSRLQDVSLSLFDTLQANDILFVDSTHVSKVNSDVNRIFFEILPRLSPGVFIHFHDIFFPFEYLKKWVYEGRAWNEAYLLRAFLQYNSAFRVVLMNSYMERYHESFFQEKMPLCLKDRGGSIWIRRI